MSKVYEMAKEFKRKYPSTVTWGRLKQHSKVIERHLNPGEEVRYVFCGQKNEGAFDFFNTSVFVLSNKRILIGRKRLLFGYMLSTITPDLFNDMQVYRGILWGSVTIDTIKEEVVITNLAKSSLPEIETNISEFMMEEKQKYFNPNNNVNTSAVQTQYKQYNDVE